MMSSRVHRVKRYQLLLRGGLQSRFDVTLNSCGNSDASDDNLSGDEFSVSGRMLYLYHVMPI